MSAPTLIERFADYTLSLRYEDIAPEAVHLARRLVFDTLGTGLGGYQDPLGQRAARFATTQMRGDEATVLGDGGRVTLEGAAFANATMMKILGMDDSHRSAGHIAAQMIPAVLATAETRQVSGREVITAIVAAYELAVRVGFAVRFEQRRRGLDLKGTVGPMASALAAGRVAGLDRGQLTNAVALAADMASGTEQYVYDPGPCDTKDLISGFAARSAVFAVKLAANGFYGPSEGLDGAYGFFRAFGEGYKPADFADLSDRFSILSTGFKPHGGCRHTHQAVDCVQIIRRQAELDPAKVQRVVVRTYKYALEPIFRVDPEPKSRKTAGLSIRQATAVALARGSAWPDDYFHWDDPAIARLRRLVEIEVDPEVEAVYPARNGCTVLVTLDNGQTYEGTVPYAKGEPEFPVSDVELKAKFDALTRNLLQPGRSDELYARCMALEHEPDAGALLSLTVVPTPEPAY